jgi:hypothetical protein
MPTEVSTVSSVSSGTVEALFPQESNKNMAGKIKRMTVRIYFFL